MQPKPYVILELKKRLFFYYSRTNKKINTFVDRPVRLFMY